MIDKANYAEREILTSIGGITHVLIEDAVSLQPLKTYPASQAEAERIRAQIREAELGPDGWGPVPTIGILIDDGQPE